jgi:hypothetical protein
MFHNVIILSLENPISLPNQANKAQHFYLTFKHLWRIVASGLMNISPTMVLTKDNSYDHL